MRGFKDVVDGRVVVGATDRKETQSQRQPESMPPPSPSPKLHTVDDWQNKDGKYSQLKLNVNYPRYFSIAEVIDICDKNINVLQRRVDVVCM
jgi:hypothetical protein